MLQLFCYNGDQNGSKWRLIVRGENHICQVTARQGREGKETFLAFFGLVTAMTFLHFLNPNFHGDGCTGDVQWWGKENMKRILYFCIHYCIFLGWGRSNVSCSFPIVLSHKYKLCFMVVSVIGFFTSILPYPLPKMSIPVVTQILFFGYCEMWPCNVFRLLFMIGSCDCMVHLLVCARYQILWFCDCRASAWYMFISDYFISRKPIILRVYWFSNF